MEGDERASHKKILGDEVLRKIGRNVLLFQQIEGLLKFLVANHNFDGSTTDFAERRKEWVEAVQGMTMGVLKQHYTDGILSDAGESTKEPEESAQSWISVTFRLNAKSEFYNSQGASLKLMVNERNDLIHHFLPRWQPESLEHLSAATSYLDQQREKVLPMFEHLKFVAESMQETRQAMADFLGSDQGKRQFELLWLQHSPLVTLMKEVAIQKARPDGWTYLSHAGQLAHFHEPDAVTRMEERYGHSTLKQLLIASELFDVLDEPLSNGGFRTIYRVK
jgi:hypothetical protein